MASEANPVHLTVFQQPVKLSGAVLCYGGDAMGYSSYDTYLRSKRWKEKRAQRIALDGGLCVLCASKATQVHHRKYPERWGMETIMDLVSLCSRCHDGHHGLVKEQPTNNVDNDSRREHMGMIKAIFGEDDG